MLTYSFRTLEMSFNFFAPIYFKAVDKGRLICSPFLRNEQEVAFDAIMPTQPHSFSRFIIPNCLCFLLKIQKRTGRTSNVESYLIDHVCVYPKCEIVSCSLLPEIRLLSSPLMSKRHLTILLCWPPPNASVPRCFLE